MSLVPNTEVALRANPGIYPRRVVSYHEAISALDAESKRLTRELGKITTITSPDRDLEEPSSATDAKPLPELVRQSRRAASSHHLPSTSNLLDPLPVSKEKEAVLSQTRPSWLPPKRKEEEKRHLAEYQKMVQLAEEAGSSFTTCVTAELKRQQKSLREKEERDRLYEDSSKVWQTWILPNWNTAYVHIQFCLQ
jgi:hypothetical protein